MAKKQAFNMEDYLRNNLQTTLREEFGRKTIERTEMPEYFDTSLNPLMPLRPYQKEAFQYFINFSLTCDRISISNFNFYPWKRHRYNWVIYIYNDQPKNHRKK